MKSKLPLYKQRLGKLGEDIAASYLQKQGYRILSRNFRARHGEIDIVCVKNNITIFVEVKTRRNEHFGSPEEAVTAQKLREIIKTSEIFTIAHAHVPRQMRIDIIALLLGDQEQVLRLHHIENVSQ